MERAQIGAPPSFLLALYGAVFGQCAISEKNAEGKAEERYDVRDLVSLLGGLLCRRRKLTFIYPVTVQRLSHFGKFVS